jgi:hypothetical protein
MNLASLELISTAADKCISSAELHTWRSLQDDWRSYEALPKFLDVTFSTKEECATDFAEQYGGEC